MRTYGRKHVLFATFVVMVWVLASFVVPVRAQVDHYYAFGWWDNATNDAYGTYGVFGVIRAYDVDLHSDAVFEFVNVELSGPPLYWIQVGWTKGVSAVGNTYGQIMFYIESNLPSGYIGTLWGEPVTPGTDHTFQIFHVPDGTPEDYWEIYIDGQMVADRYNTGYHTGFISAQAESLQARNGIVVWNELTGYFQHLKYYMPGQGWTDWDKIRVHADSPPYRVNKIPGKENEFETSGPDEEAHGNPRVHRYWVMGGTTCGCSDLAVSPPTLNWKTPFQTRPPNFMPELAQQNITFSEAWSLPGYGFIVNLTVPHETYVGLEHTWYDKNSLTWYRMRVTLEEDGYGWIFLSATGDVDCYTFNNDTGVYWNFPSSMAGELAALTGDLPFLGPDGVAGTLDDGFGDGTNDTHGSSILLLNSTMRVDYWDAVSEEWKELFDAPWPQVLTTGTAYDIVDEPDSELNGWNSTVEGQPWEFYAGLDHPGQQVSGHPKWNAYVTYVCAWSVLNYDTTLGDLDVIFQIVEKLVREDCVIADISGDEKVTITDIVIAALAFGAEDEGPGDDGVPGTGDDKPDADPNYDARGDFKPKRGKITISDIVRIALDFGAYLTPDGIIRV